MVRTQEKEYEQIEEKLQGIEDSIHKHVRNKAKVQNYARQYEETLRELEENIIGPNTERIEYLIAKVNDPDSNLSEDELDAINIEIQALSDIMAIMPPLEERVKM